MNYSNNAYSVLASGITNVATTISLAAGTGSRFPASNFLATLIGYDGSGNENAWEIVLCSSRSADTLTVTRGQEGTTAVAWSSATRIEHRVTAAGMAGLLEKTGGSMSGDLNFSGTGRRITGDFSNATVASRAMLQNSIPNAVSVVSVIPNGTATTARLSAINNSDPTNSGLAELAAFSSEVRISSGIYGSGTYLPLTIYTGGSERARIDIGGNFGLGLTPVDGRGVLQIARSFSGGSPVATGGTDPNQYAALGNSSVATRMGLFSSGAMWLQISQIADYSVNYGLALNPNGGNVSIGTASQAVKFTVGNGRSAFYANSEKYAVQVNHSIGGGAIGHWIGGDTDGSLVISNSGGAEKLRINASDGSVVSASLRTKIQGNTTFYVRTDGNDANTGLANTSGGAFLTIQRALDVCETLDFGGYTVTIQIADGTYTGASTVRAMVGQTAASRLIISGNTGTPSNVVINPTSNNCFNAGSQSVMFTITGVKLQTTTSGYGLNVSSGAYVVLNNVHFGACASGCVLVNTGATVGATGGLTFAGSSPFAFLAATGSKVLVESVGTITLTGTPNFASAFLFSENGSNVRINGNTFSGSATGTRYVVSGNSTIFTNAAGASYLPGNSAGIIQSGGQYL